MLEKEQVLMDIQPLQDLLSKNFKIGKYDSKIKLVLQNITNEEVTTRLLNNFDRQGYISFSLEI